MPEIKEVYFGRSAKCPGEYKGRPVVLVGSEVFATSDPRLIEELLKEPWLTRVPTAKVAALKASQIKNAGAAIKAQKAEHKKRLHAQRKAFEDAEAKRKAATPKTEAKPKPKEGGGN